VRRGRRLRRGLRIGPGHSGADSRKVTLSRARAGDFSKGIEDGISKLLKVIAERGKHDKAEGGIAAISFIELFEAYEHVSDMLVGLLMRA
jgi:hypothetical protein